jgi:hypothetical protein
VTTEQCRRRRPIGRRRRARLIDLRLGVVGQELALLQGDGVEADDADAVLSLDRQGEGVGAVAVSGPLSLATAETRAFPSLESSTPSLARRPAEGQPGERAALD